MLIAGIPLKHVHMQRNFKFIAQDKLKSLRRGCVPLPNSRYLMGTSDPTEERVLKRNQVAIAMCVCGPHSYTSFLYLAQIFIWLQLLLGLIPISCGLTNLIIQGRWENLRQSFGVQKPWEALGRRTFIRRRMGREA
jgi:hypothetical protein